jgi:hypothetical protein
MQAVVSGDVAAHSCFFRDESRSRSNRTPTYAVEFASAKRIRLSVNFQEPNAVPLLEGMANVSAKKTKVSFDLNSKRTSNSKVKAELDTVVVELKQEKTEKQEKHEKEEKQAKHELEPAHVVPARSTSSHDLKSLLNDDVKMEEVDKGQSAVVVPTVTVMEEASPIKPPSPPAAAPSPVIPASRKMDISMLCASASPSSDDSEVKQEAFVATAVSNGDTHHSEQQTYVQPTTETIATVETTPASDALPMKPSPVSDSQVNVKTAVKIAAVSSTEPLAVQTDEKQRAGEDSSKAATIDEHDNHPQTLTRVGSKKRMIIDDDTTNSSSDSRSDTDVAADAKKKRSKKQRSSSDPAVENSCAQSPPAKKRRKVSVSPQAIEKVAEPTTKLESAVADKQPDGVSPPATPAVNGVIASDSAPKAPTESDTNPSGSVTTAESFEVTCASCTKSYDMRYLDPPLLERPVGEWRCFECLVNDARGWPRRRKSVARGDHSDNEKHDERSSGKTRRRQSSSKPRSSSSSSKKKSSGGSKGSKSQSSSKSKSSSSSKHKKSSSSHNSSTKKASSASSSSKKHKRKSSSSSQHHSTSSSHHKGRRHHRHHPEQFTKLVESFRVRQGHRRALEDTRMQDEMREVYLEGPSGWRVASSTLDELRQLVASLTGGSLEQDRYAVEFYPCCAISIHSHPFDDVPGALADCADG